VARLDDVLAEEQKRRAFTQDKDMLKESLVQTEE
jgi:hypothetical protein